MQRFAGGIIWWSQATGAWETRGTIQARYLRIYNVASPLGFPTSGQVATSGGLRQSFAGGYIWSSPAGAWETYGAINARYLGIYNVVSPLGFPTGGVVATTGGYRQSFAGGYVWLSPAGAWETYGAINARYLGIYNVVSPIGFPASGVVPTTGGYRQRFASGFMWLSPGGAWETYGAINTRYLGIYNVVSPLGFPTGAQAAVRGAQRQTFAGGNMWWSSATGARETTGAINAEYVGAGGPMSRYGLPTTGRFGYYGGFRQDFQHGSLLAGVQRVLDATYASVTAADVWATWRTGCPVGPQSLTLIRLNFWGFDNRVHRGEIIVRSDLAGRVANVFAAALGSRFPIRSMWRVDYFGGSDPASMAADNTSGFNCRQVTGGTGLSPHSYGIAVDVNTVENPYFAGHWWPNADYVDRKNVRPGMLFATSDMTKAFAVYGFGWGASYLDYQHFQFVG